MNAHDAILKLVTKNTKSVLLNNGHTETVEPSLLIEDATGETIDLCDFRADVRDASISILCGTALRLLGYQVADNNVTYRILIETENRLTNINVMSTIKARALANKFVLEQHNESEIMEQIELFKMVEISNQTEEK